MDDNEKIIARIAVDVLLEQIEIEAMQELANIWLECLPQPDTGSLDQFPKVSKTRQ